MAEWMLLAGDFYASKVELKPHVREFLDLCRREKQEMCVLTSAVPEHCQAALRRHGLEQYFQQVFFAQSLGLDKGTPLLFQKVAALAGVKPQACTLLTTP